MLFFLVDPEIPLCGIPLKSSSHQTGSIWHVMLHQLKTNLEYAWRCNGPEGPKMKFQPETFLIDPYAKALSGGFPWGTPQENRRCRLVQEEKPAPAFKRRPLSESLIYEVHLRNVTAHPSARSGSPGTFKGLMAKIPYLADLGVNTIELLPVAEFDENESYFKHPKTGEPLNNFWGYSTTAFFAPKAGYASKGEARAEFRKMVEAFHHQGIEVILDVVFNHTGEGGGEGKVFSFKGIDNPNYYQLDDLGYYRNHTGCGNTLNCNHSAVREMILECLREWVTLFQVDGFRFDLATILARNEQGVLELKPPLLEQMERDPVLSSVKLIAEAWDVAGGYQVGHFGVGGRFSDWNDRFRNDIRRFWRGDHGFVYALALRFLGSPDVYQPHGRHPFHSINFITCHDGFTLMDLVSYAEKHNELNGEGNRDGTNENYSSNSGVEGFTEDASVRYLRDQKRRAMMATLFLSQGVPMMLGGDEFGRTQQGNNNAYCQDNEISWFDWS
ncbi:MAG: glycogen debranching enzyme, partial [Simkania sp.]|nr:glycogen debranching enzyme [Simkania sp.]